MKLKHDSCPDNNEYNKHNLSSSICQNSDVKIDQNFSNISYQSNNSSSNTNAPKHTQNSMPSNDQVKKIKKRSNSKVVKAKKLPQEESLKLQSFNTSISLPTEDDLLGSPTFYSDYENSKIDMNSDCKNEIIPNIENDSTLISFQDKEEKQNSNATSNISQFLDDSNYHKKWKKILSKMFFYDNKNTTVKKDNDTNFENSANDSPQTKELHILMNKKETKKLLKMRSDSRYHKFNTLSVLSCTKGNIVKKFKNSVFQGVPDSLRGTLWQTIIDPFHSFCIKLNPEMASLMNAYESDKDNITENTNLINIGCNQESLTESGIIKDSDNESSINSSSSCLSYTNSIPTPNTRPIIDSNFTDNGNDVSHSIEYVKVNVHTNQNIIQFLTSRASKSIIDSIEGDIGRTLIQFTKMQNPNTQLSLKRILSAYSVIDSNLGYSQGMAFIAAMLLLYMDEHASFNCFCNIMLSKRFGFRNLFVSGFPRVILMNKVWNVALQNYFPHIQRKLAHFSIDPIIYTLGWWLANFLNFPLPNDILLLLFDRCLLFGSSSLISFGLTIFGVCHEYLEKSSIDEMIALLQMPSNYPTMLNSKEVIYQWNNNFWISKKNYSKLLKKANVSYLP